MATTKPRITITLTDHQHKVLKTISESSGQSMSLFISEMLGTAMPTLERMAVTFQKLAETRTLQRERFVEAIDQAQTALEPIAQEAIGQFDLFMARLDSAASPGATDARKRAGASGAAAQSAPPTNRGATGGKAKASKASGGKALRPVKKSSGFSKTVA